MQGHTILRTARSGETRFYGRQVERERVRELRLGRVGREKESLLPGVRLHQGYLILRPPRELQVLERFRVHRENAAGGTVLRGHVADRRAVGEGQVRDPRAVELHELAHHALLPELL